MGWRSSFLLGSWPGLPQSLAVSQGPDSNMAADFPQNVREAQKPQTFYNLNSEVTSHHFCPDLCVRSETLCPAHTHEEGITQGHRYKEVGMVGGYLKGHLLPSAMEPMTSV